MGSRLASLLAEELLASDNFDVRIVCLVRSTSDTTQLATLCTQGLYRGIVEVTRVDMSNPEDLKQKLDSEKTTYIYHCAAKGILCLFLLVFYYLFFFMN